VDAARQKRVKRLSPLTCWRELCLPALVVGLVWVAMFIGISLRVIHQPERNNLVPTYRSGGEHWIRSEPLYQGVRGFIYSPPIAAAMVPLALLPQPAADVLWRLLSLSAFLASLAWWKKSGLPPRSGWPGVIFLLAPLSLGNLNNGQANLLVIALLIAAVAAIKCHCWNTAALCLVLPGYLKIYPLVLGLVFILCYPRDLVWRVLLAGIVIGLFAFFLQHPSYVLAQYHLWVDTRLQEDRSLWDAMNTPQDLWRMLMFTHMSKPIYHGIQVGSGLLIAVLALQGQRFHWSAERVLVSLFSLVCAWMILCGPATESATYILLAPAMAFAFVQAMAKPLRVVMRVWSAIVLFCELLALAIISFTQWRHSPIVLIQPVGALLFFGYGLFWAQSNRAWNLTPFRQTSPAPHE
jgi:Glycosyltransferase family 87